MASESKQAPLTGGTNTTESVPGDTAMELPPTTSGEDGDYTQSQVKGKKPTPNHTAEGSARVDPESQGSRLSRPPLLCLGAARTGTTSLSQALEMLGVEPVHHGMRHPCDDEWEWDIFNRAADATFPNLPTYTGKPFSRAEWDELCSRFAAVTDVASFYAVSLINAYPDAKVIIVERDIESWLKSIHGVFKEWENPITDWAITHIGPRTGTIRGEVSRKFQLGWTRSAKTKDIMGNARSAYERHYREIRELVPPEQLLDFKLADGWEPLCKFLGKEVPEGVKFPHANDAAAYETFRKEARSIAMKAAFVNTLKRKKKVRA